MPVEDATATEIVTQPRALSEQAAQEHVAERATARLKRLVLDRDPVRAELRYKPYFAFDVVLTKRVLRGENKITEGSIIVDALSGVSRPFTTDAIETQRETVEPSSVLAPSVNEEEALVEAKSRRMQVEHRERSQIEMEESPRTVYKPIWLVELSDESVRAVDAVEGRVYSDMLLG